MKVQRNQIFVFGVIIILAAIILIKPQFKNNQIKKILSDANIIVTACGKQRNWRGCYGDKLGDYNKVHQFTLTLKVLDKLEDFDSKTKDCHLLAHKVAFTEVEKDPSKWLQIFNFVDQTTCTNGFVHGVLEGRSRFEPSFKINAEIIPEICQQIEEKTSQRTKISIDDACAHVLGHILLAEKDGDIEKSVEECQKMKEKSYKVACFNGIFMENITRDNLVIHTGVLLLPQTQSSADEIEVLCQKFSGLVKLACFREIVHLYTVIEKNDPLKVYQDCFKGKSEEEMRACYFHAINLMILGPKFDSQKLTNLCVNFSNETDLKNCISHSLRSLLLSSAKFSDRAIVFCLGVKENMRDFCFREIGDHLKRLEVEIEQRLSLCSSAPEQYLNLCAKMN